MILHCLLLSCSYVLTLITDGMRSVRAFHFDKAAASVLTTCVSSGRGHQWCEETGSLYLQQMLSVFLWTNTKGWREKGLTDTDFES